MGNITVDIVGRYMQILSALLDFLYIVVQIGSVDAYYYFSIMWNISYVIVRLF